MSDKIKIQLLIATSNPGKIRELTELLADLPVELKGLDEFPTVTEVEETGVTFAENAVLKARQYALQTGSWSLADDSGLEVAALNNAPGVYSARYAGANSSYEEKIAGLLGELKDTPAEKRSAQFVCAMAIADPSGEIQFQTAGVCRGQIAFAAAGANGFGYDPVFIPKGFVQTFGELSGDVKRSISHRAAALAGIIGFLCDFTVV